MQEGQHATPAVLSRRIDTLTASLLVVASMVGTGVFTTTGLLVAELGSPSAVMLAWLVGGAGALAGALAYAELSAALPENGGEYALLARVYHPAVGFVAGIVSLVAGFSAPVAASALAFGRYLSRVFAVDAVAAAIGAIVFAALMHGVGPRAGGRMQALLTALNVAVILLFVVGASVSAGNPRPSASSVPLGPAVFSPAFALAVVYVSYSYGGWNAASYVAAEIREPQRGLPLALVLGTLFVTALYAALNAVFLGAVPPSSISGVVEVGHVVASSLFGTGVGRLVSAALALGLLSSIGALMLTGPRVYEAMGRDYPELGFLARRTRAGGPVAATWLQAGLALAMVVTSSFELVFAYVAFTLSLFLALTVAGVFVLRRREPALSRPYRTAGYPVTPLLALAVLLGGPLSALVRKPIVAVTGALTVLGAFLLWALLMRRRARSER